MLILRLLSLVALLLVSYISPSRVGVLARTRPNNKNQLRTVVRRKADDSSILKSSSNTKPIINNDKGVGLLRGHHVVRKLLEEEASSDSSSNDNNGDDNNEPETCSCQCEGRDGTSAIWIQDISSMYNASAPQGIEDCIPGEDDDTDCDRNRKYSWSCVSQDDAQHFLETQEPGIYCDFECEGTFEPTSAPTTARRTQPPTPSPTTAKKDPNIIVDANFGADAQGFTYLPNAFFGVDRRAGGYTSGSYNANAGKDGGGALTVSLGGKDNTRIDGVSGGWSIDFALDHRSSSSSNTPIQLTVTYQLEIGLGNDFGDYGMAIVTVDGKTYGTQGNYYLAFINGDGNGGFYGDGKNGGKSNVTPYKTAKLDLPATMSAGKHNLRVGAYLKEKNSINEYCKMRIDSIQLSYNPN